MPSLGVEQKDKTRLPLEQFRQVTESYLKNFTEAQYSLHPIYTTFKGPFSIHPAQCRGAIHSLEEVNEEVQKFCEFLNETAHLPLIFTALRYRLLFFLYLIEEHIRKLMELIDTFRVSYIASSQHAGQQREEIADSFATLLQYITDISQQIQFLNEEAQFQERHLTVDLENKGKALL